MTKKKEEDDFKFPEFDEKEFIRGEKRDIYIVFLTVLYALIIACASTGIFIITKDFVVPFFFGIVAITGLRYFFDVFRIEYGKMEKMKILGTGATYFITWIAIWVILINPPITDISPPVIKDETPKFQEVGAVIGITAFVYDNYIISSVKVMVERNGNSTEYIDMEEIEKNEYFFKLYSFETNSSDIIGTYNYTIRAMDKAGHVVFLKGSFTTKENEKPIITLLSPSSQTSNITVVRGEKIVLHITDNVLVKNVWYSLDEGENKKLKKSEYLGKKDTYIIDTKDWDEGMHKLDVFAEDTTFNTVKVSYNVSVI